MVRNIDRIQSDNEDLLWLHTKNLRCAPFIQVQICNLMAANISRFGPDMKNTKFGPLAELSNRKQVGRRKREAASFYSL